MAALHNDGTLPYGSKVLTINSVTYVAEKIDVDDPTKVIERRDELDEPSGQVITQDFVTGSATLQLETSSTALPANGQTFTADLLRAGSNQTWIVSKRGVPYAQDASHMVDIEFRKKINVS